MQTNPTSFDITDKELVLWEKYYSMMTSDNTVVKKFDPNVSDFFQNFNIQPTSKLKRRRFSHRNQFSPEITETLNSYISQMNISTSYFNICKYLYDLYNTDTDTYHQIVEQATPHIFRSFFLVIHILKIKIQNIIQEKGDNTDQLYDSIIDSIPYYIDFFIKLNNETIMDGVFLVDLLFHKISHFFPQIIKNITSPYFIKFPKLVKKLITIMTVNQLTTSFSISPFIEFLSEFFQCSFIIDARDKKERNETLITFLSISIKYCELLKNIFDSAYWSLTSFLLSYLDTLSLYYAVHQREEYFSLTMEILKFLYPFRTIFDDQKEKNQFQFINDVSFAKILAFYFNSYIHNNQFKKGNQAKTTKDDNGITSYLNETDIFDQFKVDYSKSSCDIHDYSKFKQESFLPEHSMNMICNQTSNFFKTNLNLFSEFTKHFINVPKDDDFLCRITMYCFLIRSIMKNSSCDIEIKLARALDENHIWSYLLSTDSIYDESFIINEENTQFIEAQFYIFDLIKFYLIGNFGEMKIHIINELEKLINTHSPHISSSVINYIRSYLQLTPGLLSTLIKTNDHFIRTLIKNDRIMKNILFYKKDMDDDERQLYIQTHFNTFQLIKEICDLNHSNSPFFEYDQNLISYLYSYLFETDEKVRLPIYGILTSAFDRCRTTHHLIFVLTSIIEQRLTTVVDSNDDFIFEIFQSMIHIFIISSQKNPKDTIKNILNCNSIQSLSNIPEYLIISYSHSTVIDEISNDFKFNDENQKNILIIIQYLIQLYTFISKMNKSAFKLLNSSQSQEIISSSKYIAKFIQIDQSTYDYFLTFLCGKKIYELEGMEKHRIVNFGGINFIYDWTYNTEFFDTFLDNLISLTENSLSNSYQLFKCQIKSRLLQYILENPTNANPKAYSLYNQISLSFFSITDVKDVLQAIMKSDKECSTKLLEIFSNILNNDYSKLPNSFFHISGEFDNKLVISKLAIRIPFVVSTKVLFEKNITKSTFMEITDEMTQLLILIDDNQKIHLEASIGTEKFVCNKCFPFHSNQWYKIKLRITYENVEIYLDKKLQLKFTIPSQFDFNENSVKIQFIGDKCNIDDIKVKDLKNNKKIANFTAKLLHSKSNRIFNTIESQARARFNGIYAPYSPRLIESIISCGGPKIILPLFTVISKAKNQLEYFRLLLVSLHTFMKKKEESFMKINFFRIFNHLLSSIPINEIKSSDDSDTKISFFPLNCSNEIIGIYQSIQSDELREEMTIYFWSDFALCAKFEHFIPFFYADNLEQLQRWMTIQRCTSSIDHVDSPIYIDTLVALLIFMFDKSIDNKIAQFLLTVINMKSIGETCGIIFIQVISHYVQLKNNSILNALKNTNYYFNFDALIDLANHSKSVTLTLWIIRAFLIICHTIPEAKNGLFGALCKFNYFEDDIEISKEETDELFEAFSVFLFESETSIYQVPFTSIKLKKEGVKGLRYVQFIPLICKLFKFYSENEKIKEFIYLLYNTFFIDTKSFSQLFLNYLPYWHIWLFFIMQNEQPDQMKRWIQVIQIILKLDLNQFENIVSFLYIFCSINQQCFTDLLFEMFNFIFCQNSTIEMTKKLIFLVLKLIVLQPTISTQTENKNEDKTDFKLFLENILGFSSKIELNLEFYKSSNIQKDELSKISDLSIYLMNHICDNLESKIIVYSGGSTVTIGYFIVILLSKLMQTNEKVYFEIIKKILMNTDTNNTFVRIIHLSLVHYFSNNKDYGSKIIQIVKNENPEFKTATKDTILMTADLMLDGFNDSISKYIQTFPQEFETMTNNFIETIQKEIQKKNQIETRFSDIENYKQIILYYMKTQNYNAKIWNEMFEGMKLEASNVWSVPNLSNHRKYSKRYDLIGRHLFTTRNKIFNDHMDASRSRDEGKYVVSEAKFIDHKPIETNKKTILSILNIDCRMLTTESLFIGTLFIESGLRSIIFESKFYCDPILEDQKEIQKVITIDLSTVKYILWRRYHHIDNSIELLGTKSYFFTFQDNKERQTLLNELEKVKFMFPNIVYIQNKPSSEAFQSLHFTERWRSGDMTNYEYLFWVNMFSGRSYCDVSQYPVFPWVIQNYTSPHLNLNDPDFFRDLTQPIGVLNPERIEKLKELKMDVAGTENYCLYRFHYSTAFYVIFYLLRLEPFTSMHISLQKNKFDSPNRLFKSIDETWKNVVSVGMDFKELIPEFFTLPFFLLNTENYDLGVLPDTNERVSDVSLPAWSNTASQFIALHRLALESPIVSEKIDHWIDLVFGYKQRGAQAEEALNDFHPFSYSSAVDELIAQKADEEEVEKIQYFAANFGITPEQLFKEKHPSRSTFLSLSRGRQVSTSSDFRLSMSNFPVVNGVDVVMISIENDRIFTIDSKCKMSKYKRNKERWSLVDSSISFASFELSDAICDHLAIIPSLRIALISAPWSDKFSLFRMKSKISFSGNSIKPLFSSPRHNSCISVARASKSFVAVGTQNADVRVWDIQKSIAGRTDGCSSNIILNVNSNLNDFKEKVDDTNLFRNSLLLIGHSSPIVDIAIDESMDTIISIDESQLLICFSISTGKQIFSLQLATTVKRIFLSKLGFIIVVSEVEHRSSSAACSRRSSSFSASNNESNTIDEYSANSAQFELDNSTSISLFDLSGKLVEMTDFSGSMSCVELIETVDCSEFLACSFENCTFVLIRVYDLFEVLRTKTFSKICLMAFARKEMYFLFRLANNGIVKAELTYE